jgi:hypothetical protein
MLLKRAMLICTRVRVAIMRRRALLRSGLGARCVVSTDRMLLRSKGCGAVGFTDSLGPFACKQLWNKNPEELPVYRKVPPVNMSP